jgi:hypothetical protein
MQPQQQQQQQPQHPPPPAPPAFSPGSLPQQHPTIPPKHHPQRHPLQPPQRHPRPSPHLDGGAVGGDELGAEHLAHRAKALAGVQNSLEVGGAQPRVQRGARRQQLDPARLRHLQQQRQRRLHLLAQRSQLPARGAGAGAGAGAAPRWRSAAGAACARSRARPKGRRAGDPKAGGQAGGRPGDPLRRRLGALEDGLHHVCHQRHAARGGVGHRLRRAQQRQKGRRRQLLQPLRHGELAVAAGGPAVGAGLLACRAGQHRGDDRVNRRLEQVLGLDGCLVPVVGGGWAVGWEGVGGWRRAGGLAGALGGQLGRLGGAR